jgi:RNA polymerase sigma-70 factor (ECF subfamily)
VEATLGQHETWAAELSDDAVVARIRAGETALFELLMRRYNRRLYRTARAILRDDHEAEDAIQEAYVQAYVHLDQFEGRAQLSSWLTRIAVHEALRRLRRRGRIEEVGEEMPDAAATTRGPEQEAARAELRRALESAVDELPEAFRTTFVLRDIEELSTAETADSLGIPEQTVKTRLHRARALLRQSLRVRFGEAAKEAFPFGFAHCDRVVAGVMARIATLGRRGDA